MKRIVSCTFLFTVFILVFCILSTAGASGPLSLPRAESGDRTLSPYFFVKDGGESVDRMPLKGTSTDASISGVIADVRVRQVYKNEGKKPLEAVYVFPASTRAAVYAMKMTIGKRVIEAKINKRDEARREYEAARDGGQTASLLEQQRPNVFQMSVAHILPGDEITVELGYTELLVPTAGVYEFVYPTVVGPRYSARPGENAASSEQWVQNPYLRQGEAPGYTSAISATILSPIAIKEIASSSHKVKISYEGPTLARVTLDTTEKHSGNRDYILRYRLDGNRIESGLLLYEGEKENFFLLMTQPPKRIANTQIPGREYIFIVDVSGSMWGYPLDITKKLMNDLLKGLRPIDLFNVLLFSGGSKVMAEESIAATEENIRRAASLISRQQGGGGTELLPALKRALNMPKKKDYARTVVLATDGYVNVEEEVFELIGKNLGEANIFPFGIGTSVNRHIIEGMARVGMGEPFIITRPEEASSRAEHFRNVIRHPVLTGINVSFQNFDAYDIEPPAAPDLFAERPVVMFGKYRGKAAGKIVVSGMSGDGRYAEIVDPGKVQPSKCNGALRYLWARHRISLLSDYNRLRADEKRVGFITELGLTYNLLTAYTSFVAVDTGIRATDGRPVTVRQPLPLPLGVSDYAIGESGGVRAMMPVPSPMGNGGMFAARELKIRREPPTHGTSQDSVRVSVPTGRTIRMAETAVDGGLSKEDVSNLVRTFLPSLVKCWKTGGPGGEVTVRLVVGADGRVKRAAVIRSTTGTGGDVACLKAITKAWQFPRTSDGKEAGITISFVVSP